VTKLLINLNDKANEVVSVFKIRYKLRTKEEAINQIIVMHGGLL
jgi:hypothetical protein